MRNAQGGSFQGKMSSSSSSYQRPPFQGGIQCTSRSFFL